MRKVSGIRGLRWLFLVLAAALAAPLACSGDAPESQPAPPSTTVESDAGVRAVPVARGLDRPVHVAFAPGEPDRLYALWSRHTSTERYPFQLPEYCDYRDQNQTLEATAALP